MPAHLRGNPTQPKALLKAKATGLHLRGRSYSISVLARRLSLAAYFQKIIKPGEETMAMILLFWQTAVERAIITRGRVLLLPSRRNKACKPV